jgi:glycosyltransferase involved in cell wall biosynthesis
LSFVCAFHFCDLSVLRPNLLKKVAHILGELCPSGAEMMVKLAAHVWRAMDWDLQIVSTGQITGSFASQFAEIGVPVVHCPEQKGLGWSADYSRAIRAINPDIVHEHSEGRNLLKTCVPAIQGKKVFRTIHNVFPYTGFLRFQKILERSIARFLGVHTITISQSVHDNELNRLHNPSSLCWNWFNDSLFRPPFNDERSKARLELGLQVNEVVVVTVGNGNDTKNYSALIKALSRLRNKTSGIRYLMVGHEHPEGIERQVAKEAGVENLIVFAGPQKDVQKYLWAADVYIMPSKHEGFSIAALEALASGVSCIFAKSPGLVDLGRFPLEITWTSPDTYSIADALSGVLQQPDLMQPNTKNAALVRDYFGVERRASAYADLWKQSLTT